MSNRIAPSEEAPEQEAIIVADEQTVGVSGADKSGCGRMWCLFLLGPCACVQASRFIWFGQPLVTISQKVISWLYIITAFNFIGAILAFGMLMSPQNLLADNNHCVVRWLFALSKFFLGLSGILQFTATGAAAIIGNTLLAIPQGRMRLFLQQNARVLSTPGSVAAMAFVYIALGFALRLVSQNLSSLHPSVKSANVTSMTGEDIGLFAVSTAGFGIGFLVSILWAWTIFKMWFTSFHSSHVMELLDKDVAEIKSNIRKES